ncbi:MAG: hypothetical protein ACTSQQ_17490, partial [Candidatus Helarchaeota archaeon]
EIPPAPKPPPISPLPSAEKEWKEELPQPIALDTSVPESPQLIDPSLEPPEVSEEILETPPDTLEIPPDIDISATETIDLSARTVTTPPAPSSKEEIDEQISPSAVTGPLVSEEEQEARSIISFFKESVEELSEEEKAEARRKREAKRKKMLDAKKKKQQQQKPKTIEDETKEVENLLRDVIG